MLNVEMAEIDKLEEVKAGIGVDNAFFSENDGKNEQKKKEERFKMNRLKPELSEKVRHVFSFCIFH